MALQHPTETSTATTDDHLAKLDPISVFAFDNGYGRPMNARLLFPGDRWGRGGCLVWGQGSGSCIVNPEARKAILEENAYKVGIEFYDAKYQNDPRFAALGQFITNYYLDTLLGKDRWSDDGLVKGFRGLCLQGDVPEWSIAANAIKEVLAWAQAAILAIRDRVLMEALADIAGTPIEGEPCPDDPSYTQYWDHEGMEKRFNAMILKARKAVTLGQKVH
jgi:hypothetical protein